MTWKWTVNERDGIELNLFFMKMILKFNIHLHEMAEGEASELVKGNFLLNVNMIIEE